MRNLPVCRYSVLLGYRRDCFFCSQHRDIVNPNQPKTIISRIAGEDEEENEICSEV